jgi:hypothetical protein
MKLALLIAVVFIVVAPGRCHQKILATCTKFYQTSMAGPLGVVSVAPATATTKVEEDVNDGPLERC